MSVLSQRKTAAMQRLFRVFSGVVVGSFLLAALAGAGAAGAVVVQFRTPTGNIGCAFSSGLTGFEAPTVRCDIRSRLHPEPKPPATCRLDYGDSIQVFARRRPSLVCHGDTAIDPRSRVVAYGHEFSRAGITCVSRITGMTCTNRTGHGFFLSRESWRLF
jgi:hypothetical protein